jgi:hypothetical protein
VKTFALAILILSLGTVAMRSLTHADRPQSQSRFDLDIVEELSAVQTDISQLAETLQVIDEMKATQDKTNSVLDQVVQHLKKSASVKYVTKSDLDFALDTAKQSIEQVKTASPSGCDCNCDSKIAELESRIEKLESLCASKTTSSSYSTKSGGSTGAYTQTVGNGGSTGTVSSSVYSEPAITYVERPAVFSRAVTNTSSVASPQQCYIDANGNSVCPTSVQSSQNSRTTTISRPRLFRR